MSAFGREKIRDIRSIRAASSSSINARCIMTACQTHNAMTLTIPGRRPNKPPRSHYWPKRDQAARRYDVKLQAICRRIVTTAPHLDDKRYRPMVVSLVRIMVLVERAWDTVAAMDSLTTPDAGELRPSLTTLAKLIDSQNKTLTLLGLSPVMLSEIVKERTLDLPAACAELPDNANGNKSE